MLLGEGIGAKSVYVETLGALGGGHWVQNVFLFVNALGGGHW